MPAKAVCADCQITYPEGLLAPFFTEGTYTPICGICALRRINTQHAVRWTRFRSELAETKRQQAVAYRAYLRKVGR